MGFDFIYLFFFNLILHFKEKKLESESSAPYLYDLLQRAQPGQAVVLEDITGAVLDQHGEKTQTLEPGHQHKRAHRLDHHT